MIYLSSLAMFSRLFIPMVALVLTGFVTKSNAGSFYTTRLEDPKAIYFTPQDFSAHPDGSVDDSGALQQAIDKVQATTHQGIVFVPEGTYRLDKTVYVWEGIRLIGYGAKRPTFRLAKNTPGYQEVTPYDPEKPGSGNYMLHFVANKPRPGGTIRDANPGTFYSGLSNIDIEIGEGNPAAIGIRFHVAQHCYIAHADFRIGSGKAGMEEIGNEMDDCHFFGGDYGIMTSKPSPSWPFVLIDSSFEGQRVAGIDTEEGGFAIIRGRFRNMPSAVVVRKERTDILWIKDSGFRDITGPAVVIGMDTNARSQTAMERVYCSNVPVFALLRDSGKEIKGTKDVYEVYSFCHGLQITDGSEPAIKTTVDLGPPLTKAGPTADLASEPVPSDIPVLPPCDTWVNLRDLGAKGDGKTDDTKAFQDAIASHRAIYIPSGRYLVTDTLALKPDTVLIGLNPITTQIDLPDNAPAFVNEGKPKALLLAPKGGENIVTGIGIDAGYNPGAIGMKWMAGEHSLVNDVRFLGGHGTFNPDGTRVQVYNNNHTGDPDQKRLWDAQYASLWVTDGGGGTFKDIWTPDTFAQAGVYVSDTKTPGRMYAISIEHHVRNEVKLKNVSGWQFYAMQTEEERGEGPRCLPYDIDDCSDLTFANVYLYRVTTDFAFPYGIRVRDSRNLRFYGLHAYSPGKTTFDNTVFDATHNLEIRSREIALLTLTGNPPAKRVAGKSPELAPGAKIEKAVGGFEAIDGIAADAAGNIWFVDPRTQRIYRWSPEKSDLELMRDSAIDPLALAFDKAGDLLIVSRSGMVYACPPGAKEDELTTLEPVDASPKSTALALIPINRWRDEHDFLSYTMRSHPFRYVSPDGSRFIPADDDFLTARRVQPASEPNAPRRRWPRSETVDLLRAYMLTAATPGQPFYIADEFGQRTWQFSVGADGTLTDPKLFAEEGEAGIAVDKQGNVYVAAGNIFVYDSAGKLIDTILVPERPSSLAFGGKDGKTLYITARTSLYQIKTKHAGR